MFASTVLRLRKTYHFVRLFFRPPDYEGARLTSKRLWNFYRARWAHYRLHTRVGAVPVKLTLEPTSVCNLECPACFTGAGEVGRARRPMSLDCYRLLLAELGDRLLQIEFYNWGEPLLAKDVYVMIAEAVRLGISTTISTNFSIPFDAEKAERLVRSGLHVLGVSLDGVRQATYEQYRVRGKLDTCCRTAAW